MTKAMNARMWVVACAAFLAVASGSAQDMRDPTAVPFTPAPGLTAAAASPLREVGNTVVVRNGTPYLVVGTRLVGVGQRVGTATLERITETEIWLRDANRLQKNPRFEGIQRQSAGAPTPALVCAGAKTPPKKKDATAPRSAASCGGPQP